MALPGEKRKKKKKKIEKIFNHEGETNRWETKLLVQLASGWVRHNNKKRQQAKKRNVRGWRKKTTKPHTVRKSLIKSENTKNSSDKRLKYSTKLFFLFQSFFFSFFVFFFFCQKAEVQRVERYFREEQQYAKGALDHCRKKKKDCCCCGGGGG